ncbi:MAG: thiamine phosphate synthase [Pseudomonadota bacterium]
MDPKTLRLYLIVDADGRYDDLTDRVRAACSKGDVTLVQLRSKGLDARAQVDLTRDLARTLTVPVLVNDRVDIAFVAGAAGVHVGQTDIHPEDAHAIIGQSGLVGLTVRSVTEARAAPLGSLDYVSIGGVFSTSTKSDAAEPIGLDGLREIAEVLKARDARMPLCAIAGMTAERAGDVVRQGVDGVCVASAILGADDPAAAAAEIADAVRAAL